VGVHPPDFIVYIPIPTVGVHPPDFIVYIPIPTVGVHPPDFIVYIPIPTVGVHPPDIVVYIPIPFGCVHPPVIIGNILFSDYGNNTMEMVGHCHVFTTPDIGIFVFHFKIPFPQHNTRII
jgi:hypothetical protein